jgi:hypothetical protein
MFWSFFKGIYNNMFSKKKKLMHHQAQALPGPSRTDGGAQKD